MATPKRLTTGILPPSAGDVLLVEDDPQVREGALEILALGGFLVAAVGNGAEALAHLTRETPALILLDLRMPVLDGWEFLRRRAASPTLSDIPVMILSGEPLDRSLAAESIGWIAKPFTEDELLAGVTGALQRIAGQQRVQRRRQR